MNGNTSTARRITARTTTTMTSPLSILPHLAPRLSVAGEPLKKPSETPAKQERLRKSGAPFGTPRVEALLESSLHHPTHAAACGHSGHVLFGLGHDDFRGHDEAAYGGGVLQGGARDHGRVGYTGRDEVLVLS